MNKDVIQGENIYVFCSNNPVKNEDPSGYVVIKRWMISTPIDVILMLIPGAGSKLAGKIPTEKLLDMIAGMTCSIAINKILNVLIPNIDILLSIGGAISGILDYVFDKKLDNSIWVV